MKGLCSILAFIFIISQALLCTAESPCKMSLLMDPQILQNIPADESRVVFVDYVLPSNYRTNQTGFGLDHRYHTEEEINDFFSSATLASPTELKITLNSEKAMNMGEYRLFFFVKFTKNGTNIIEEARLDVPVSFKDTQSQVSLNVSNSSIKGLFNEVTISVEQPDKQKLEYSLHYIIQKTGYHVMVNMGYSLDTIDNNTVRFPIPQGQKELYAVLLRYKRDGRSGVIRKFVQVERPSNVNLSQLIHFMNATAKWGQGELVAFTHSIVNVAFRPEDFMNSSYPYECDSLYCSRQGKCKWENIFKRCECKKGFEGVRCTMPVGQTAQVKKIFSEILKDLANGEAGKTTVNDSAEIVSQIASVHSLLGYEFIDEMLKLIEMLAPQARAKGFDKALTMSLKSIVDRLTHLAFTHKFKYADKKEYEQVGSFEQRFAQKLVHTARIMRVDDDTFKDVTVFHKRMIEGPSATDKIKDWLRNHDKNDHHHVDEHEIS